MEIAGHGLADVPLFVVLATVVAASIGTLTFASIGTSGANPMPTTIPFANAAYLHPAAGLGYTCTVNAEDGSVQAGTGQGIGPVIGPGICFGVLATATVFGCASAAASSTGCTVTVTSTYNPNLSYNATVFYPRNYTGDADANCLVTSAVVGSFAGWCVSVGGNSFVVAVPPAPQE